MKAVRAVPVEETWERVRAVLSRAGITRLADITMLDDIGMPVWQAVRPGSANLSVSQGKGLEAVQAKVSAAMESIELHCAEEPGLPSVHASATEMDQAGRTRVDLADVQLDEVGAVTAHTALRWCPVTNLATGTDCWWPWDAVAVDFRMRPAWYPPGIRVTSNGLASGNTLAEATRQGLCELIERHAMARARVTADVWVDAVAPRPPARGAGVAGLLRRLTRAGCTVQVVDVTHPELAVPTFMARVWSTSLPQWFAGSGAHGDPEVALLRALTEAVQSRLTAIAGVRDDVQAFDLDFLDSPPAPAPERPLTALLGAPGRADTVAGLVRCCRDAGIEVFRADLSRPELGIPVVRVVGTGLRFAERSHG